MKRKCDNDMKRIAITGPTGAIGIALIKKCIKKKIEVYAFCRKKSKRVECIPKSEYVHVIGCDLENLNSFIVDDLPDCDVFYHLGWAATIGDGRNNIPLQLKNVQYTLDAVELAERLGCEVFVGAGSQAEYGRFEGKLNASVPTFPENGYGMAKLCAGQMSRVECQKRNIRHIWTRILSVYGPYDGELTMITSTIRKLLNGEVPALTKGEQQWDYLYSDDAARALLLLGEKGVDGKIYCLGSGKAQPLIRYMEIMRDAINTEAKLGVGEIPYGTKQVMYLCADIEDLQKDTGFEPQIDFAEGIKRTIDWIKEKGGL